MREMSFFINLSNLILGEYLFQKLEKSDIPPWPDSKIHMFVLKHIYISIPIDSFALNKNHIISSI